MLQHLPLPVCATAALLLWDDIALALCGIAAASRRSLTIIMCSCTSMLCRRGGVACVVAAAAHCVCHGHCEQCALVCDAAYAASARRRIDSSSACGVYMCVLLL